MNIQLPQQVEWIIGQLSRAGFEAYAVGGCVRDSILGRTPDDWDITTSALPEQVKGIFDRTIDTGIEHGTVTVMVDHVGYEVTTYRIDGEYKDSRHPESVSFTANLVEDLRRRDFTINAMAYNNTDGLVDVFDGQADLERGLIRAVGNAEERFTEDALRMLRAVRFSAQLGFEIEEETRLAVRRLAPSLVHVSAERIQVELVKLLISDHPERLEEAYELGLTRIFLPEFDVMMKSEQLNPHHIYTVGGHTLKVMENVPADRVLRITAMLHDVAKPKCTTLDENGINHFQGHPEEGAVMARVILRRLKFDRATIDKVCHFILWHDAYPASTAKSVRHFVSKVGLDYFPDLFTLKRADVRGQNPEFVEPKLQRIDELERIYNEIITSRECVSLHDLAISGKDLLEVGIEQGRAIGDCLSGLLDIVLDEPALNTREDLLRIVKEQYI